MLCKIFFGYILGCILGYILGYSLGIKHYVGTKFCVTSLSQGYSLAVIDPDTSRSQRVFPRRKAFTKVILKSFPVRPYFRLVKAKPVFTNVPCTPTPPPPPHPTAIGQPYQPPSPPLAPHDRSPYESHTCDF